MDTVQCYTLSDLVKTLNFCFGRRTPLSFYHLLPIFSLDLCYAAVDLVDRKVLTSFAVCI